MNKDKKTNNIPQWISERTFNFAILNIYLISLVLLRSAGYFEPYLTISINFIFFSSLILSIFLLGLTSRGALLIALIFWVLSGILVLLDIKVWAERAAVYSYEAFSVALFLMIFKRNKYFRYIFNKLDLSSKKESD